MSRFRTIGLIVGLIALGALATVLFLTVQRAQQLQSTVSRPKAYGGTPWPQCAKEGPYAYQGDLGCCANIPSKGSDACAWPARGWCKPSQCSAGINIPNNCSDCAPGKDCTITGGGKGCLDPDGKCQNKSQGCRCGLYYQDSTSTCQQSCTWQFDCQQGFNCVDGACVLNTNPCWNPQPIPINGKYDSTNQSLLWEWDTKYSGDVKGAVVYVWTDPNRTGNAYAVAGASASTGFKSVSLKSFTPALVSGTTYYWLVNPNSYHSPDAKYECMNNATKGWTFEGPSLCPAGQTTCGGSCVDLKTDANNCGGCGAKCAAGQTCVNSVCTLPPATTGTIQGFKVVMPGSQKIEPAQSQTLYLDGGATASTNPYFFLNVPAGSHKVSINVPQGYSVGYTLCYNSTACHTNTPTPGDSVMLNVPAGYTDLWWHFTQNASTCHTDSDCTGGKVCAFP